jgi:hypothetical protein
LNKAARGGFSQRLMRNVSKKVNRLLGVGTGFPEALCRLPLTKSI